MKKYLITICLIMVILNMFSQSFEWAIGMGGSNQDQGRLIAVDEAGNIYTVGTYEYTVDFDPGPGVFELTSNGNADVFISKIDATGNFIWAKSFGNSIGDFAYSLSIDDSSNVLLTGSFIGTVDFDPGPSVFNLAAYNGGGCFIVKLNSFGDFIWAKCLGGMNSSYGFCLQTNSVGEVFTCGTFSMVEDFDPGPGVYNLTASGGSNMFISKLDAAGNFVWAKNIGGGDEEYAASMALDTAGNIYMTGSFNGISDFDPGPGIFNITSNGLKDIFISKFDSSGNVIWTKGIGGIDDDIGMSIDVDEAGNIFFGGRFYDTIDFDLGPSVFNLSSPPGMQNIFISKFDPAGNFIWAKNMGLIDISQGKTLKIDGSANIYTTGGFQGTIDFDPNNGIYNLVSTGSIDIFILKLDSSGCFVWSRNMGGSSLWPADKGHDLVLDNSGNIYVTGYFGVEADLDPGSGFYNLASAGDIDAFVVKLSPCPENSTTITETACISYNFYGDEITTSGIYNHYEMTPEGCDSIITLNLTILSVDTSVTQNANTLTAHAIGASYQWIDCGNLNTAIPGETNQSFTSTINGSFAVIVTENGCTDTSACLSISNIGISADGAQYGKFQLSPNPAKDNLTISSPSEISIIELYSPSGQLLRKIDSDKKQETIDVSGLAPGNYFIRAISKEDVWVKKFVVVR